MFLFAIAAFEPDGTDLYIQSIIIVTLHPYVCFMEW